VNYHLHFHFLFTSDRRLAFTASNNCEIMVGMEDAGIYADHIIHDKLEEIAAEVPTIYEDGQIERIYTFNDGAVVKYEWRALNEDGFNHRFTLVKMPKKNPFKLKEGIIKTINY